MSFLTEAFKSLDMLDEEAFDVTSDGMEELKAFKDGDIENGEESIEIYDLEADTIDDIQDSYIGKVITDCCVCHSKFYNDEESIEIDQESGLANTSEECAFCGSTEGFTIIGKVAPFDGAQEDETQEDEPQDEETPEDVDDEVDEIEVTDEVEEEPEEDDDKEKNESIKRSVKRTNRLHEGIFGNKKAKKSATSNKSLSKNIDDVTLSTTKEKRDYLTKVGNITRSDLYSKMTDSEINQAFDVAKEYDGGTTWILADDSSFHRYMDGIGKKYDKRESKKRVHRGHKLSEMLVTREESLKDFEFWSGARETAKYLNDEDFDYIESILESEYPNGIDETNLNDLFWFEDDWIAELLGYEDFDALMEDRDGAIDESCKRKSKKALKEAPTYELEPQYDSRKSFYRKAIVDSDETQDVLYSYNTKVAEIKDGKPILYGDWDYSPTTLRHVKEFLRQRGFKADSVHQIRKDYLQESVNITIDDDTNIDIASTSDTNINVGQDVGVEEEVIAPLDDEDIETIENNGEENTEEEEPVEGEEPQEEEEIDIGYLDDDNFDDLGESFLKNVYGNVKSYTTKDVYTNGDSIFVEGVVEYKSGKKSNTKFVFEANKIDTKGKVHFLGENKHFTRKKGIFDLQGKVRGKSFIPEKLSYKYKVKGTLVEGVQRVNRKHIQEKLGKKTNK